MTNKCTKNKSHATYLGITARLTAVALTKLGDVSTVAKTLVEPSMMSSRILTPRGASIVKLLGCTSRRLHSCCPCMVLHDSVQLRCPRHATSHRSIYRRGGTRRWLFTSISCLIGHVVCLGKSCAPPQMFHVTHCNLPTSAPGSQFCGSC